MVDGIIVFFATYLAYILIILFIAIVLFSRDSRWGKWYTLFVAGAAALVARFGVTELIRFFYHRPRPFLVLPVNQLLTDPSWSFPSGHATFFFALATAVYLHHKKWGIFFFVAAALISIARVAAGVHYPSDIVAGAVVGVLVASVMVYLFRKMVPPKATSDLLT